jgi:hypothetical protein
MSSPRPIIRRNQVSRPLATTLLLGLLAATGAFSAGITGARWSGNDFVVGFTDSVGYSLDLGLSDSTQLVIRIAGVEPNDRLFHVGSKPGPNDAEALLSPTPDGGRLTITFPKRYGYSTVWRPYTHRLIVHTFDWDALSYGELQYHKGLLALEGGYVKQAEELLALAYATGEERAGSVLGVHYARLGNDSLAGRYLHHAIDEDDRIAMKSIGREPNAIAATDDMEQPTERSDSPRNEPDRTEQPSHLSTSGDLLTSLSDWRTITAIIVAVVSFTIILTVLFRRNSKSAARARQQKLDEEERKIAEGVREERRQQQARTTAENVPPTPAPKPQEPPPPPQTVAPAEEPRTPTQPVEHPPAAVAPAVESGSTEDRNTSTGTPADEKAPVSDTKDAPKEPTPAAETTPPPVTAEAPNTATATPTTTTERTDAAREETQPRKTSTQAAELQRRIEAARHEREGSGGGGSTVSEAKRLNVSRDNVELRRRMTELRKKIDQSADTWDT